MRIEIRGIRLDLDPQLHGSVERRARLALSRFAARILHVRVLVSDINGPRGGIDCQCQVRVAGHDGWRIVISDVDEEPGRAIACALDRAGRTVARELERQRSHGLNPRFSRRAS